MASSTIREHPASNNEMLENPYRITSAQYEELKRVQREDREQVQRRLMNPREVRVWSEVAIEIAGLCVLFVTVIYCLYRLSVIFWGIS